MLEFQMAEIDSASLKTGEDKALHQERDQLLNHKLIADTLPMHTLCWITRIFF